MKNNNYGVILTGIISLFFMSSSFATPIGWTSNTVNGATVLIDTNGLEWLSPVNTTGESYNDITTTGNAWTNNYGFEFATQTEYFGLLNAYGLPSRASAWDTSVYSEIHDVINDFGFTSGSSSSYSLNANVELSLGVVGYEILQTLEGGSSGTLFAGGVYGGGQSSYVGSGRGNWLVRDSNVVPEPTSLALLGLGLAGFGFSRKKKKA